MKLRVETEEGDMVTIEVRNPSLQVGGVLDRLVCDGVEYFFTKDGYYDGWGRMGGPMLPSDLNLKIPPREILN